MADHAHTQIVSAVVTALTGLTTSGARVFANRRYAMDTAQLPGLRISADQDSVTPETVHTPHVQQHQLDLVVECCAQANASLDTTCNQMQKEVEIALASGISVGGKTLFPVLTGSRYDDEPANTPAGVKRVEFAIEYFTLNNAPDALI